MAEDPSYRGLRESFQDLPQEVIRDAWGLILQGRVRPKVVLRVKEGEGPLGARSRSSRGLPNYASLEGTGEIHLSEVYQLPS